MAAWQVREIHDLEAYLAELPGIRRPRLFGPGEDTFPAPRAILLGNGWSCANSDRYAYGSLLGEMSRRGLPEGLRELVSSFGGDVERALAELDAWSLRSPAEDGQHTSAGEAAKTLRTYLIETIIAVNDDGNQEHRNEAARTEIQRRQDHAWRVLQKFSRVFTTNYDLLLYYVYIRALRQGEADRWRDGFTNRLNSRLVSFTGFLADRPEIYFLHGGLHLLEHSTATCKRTAFRGDDDDPFPESILLQATSGIRSGTYPLFVAEGSSAAKRSRIDSNGYLSAAWARLQALSGHLVCYGFSFSDADSHLSDALASNPNLLSIAASYRRAERRGRVEERLGQVNDARVKANLQPLALSVFASSHLDVWGTSCGRCGFPVNVANAAPPAGLWATCDSCYRDLVGL